MKIWVQKCILQQIEKSLNQFNKPEIMNKTIERDGSSGSEVYNARSLATDFRTLIPSLKKGLKVLDVGCGTGAISKGIAELVGPEGNVTAIDNDNNFIENGKKHFSEVKNLTLINANLFEFETEEKFDLIVAARMLQWLSTPVEALRKMRSMLKPGGQISILDYNHEALEFSPQPPKSMQYYYQKWLQWRSDAGMNNCIAEDLPNYFKEIGMKNIQFENSDEVYTKGEYNFESKIGIWTKVAEMPQVVNEGYITNEERLQAISEYNEWILNDAEQMIMKLKEVRGWNL